MRNEKLKFGNLEAARASSQHKSHEVRCVASEPCPTCKTSFKAIFKLLLIYCEGRCGV